MAIDDKPEDIRRMHYIRDEIGRLCLQYRENTEAALVIGALLINARILLLKYPEATRQDLLRGIIPFLKGEDLEREPTSLALPSFLSES